jgi:hypothetical protein
VPLGCQQANAATTLCGRSIEFFGANARRSNWAWVTLRTRSCDLNKIVFSLHEHFVQVGSGCFGSSLGHANTIQERDSWSSISVCSKPKIRAARAVAGKNARSASSGHTELIDTTTFEVSIVRFIEFMEALIRAHHFSMHLTRFLLRRTTQALLCAAEGARQLNPPDSGMRCKPCRQNPAATFDLSLLTPWHVYATRFAS